MKKVFGVLLVLMLCMVLVPVLAGAEIIDRGQWTTTQYTLDDTGLLTISGTGQMPNYSYSNNSPFYQNDAIRYTVSEAHGSTDS